MKKLIEIPFMGFYESVHDYNFQKCLEQDLPEIDELENINDDTYFDLSQRYCSEFSYTKAIKDTYCIEYVSQLNKELENKLGLIFNDLDQPKEYNFESDRLFCLIGLDKVKLLRSLVDEKDFFSLVLARFTSRDGFISAYSSNVKDWGNLSTWDHNQLGALMSSFCNSELNDDWESYSMDDYNSNGYLSDLVERGLSNKGENILKVIESFKILELS